MDKEQVTEYSNRDIIGFVEPVAIYKSKRTKQVFNARIDTGATKCSIDKALVKEFKLGPVIGETYVRNANGREKRDIVKITFQMAHKTMTEVFTVADRESMIYPVLIGRNVLRKGFLIDPNKKTQSLPQDQSSLNGFFK
ncbi:MAG: RimK/LysX family protein [Candidatus Nanoarchaeia archaeon]